MDQVVGKHRTHFIKRTPLNDEVQTNFFAKPEGFDFYAGQYLRWILPDDNADERGTSRYFTNSSSPTEEFLSISTKRGQSTFKNKLFSLVEGDELDFFGPLGNLFVNTSDNTPKVMLAGGIGITPFRSILKYANDQKLLLPLVLLVSFSLKSEVIFYDELKEIEANNKNIKVVYTLTKEEAEGFDNGRIGEEMIKKYAPNFEDSTFFIVGPPVMSQAMTETAEQMGVPEEKIVRENFTGY